MSKSSGWLFFLVASGALAAGAPVEDLSSGGQGYPQTYPQSSYPAQSQPANQGRVDLYGDIQELREEVRDLRGILEEQANEIRQLKQRQMDDYQDLDRRLSEGGGVNASVPPKSTSSSKSESPKQQAVTPAVTKTAEPQQQASSAGDEQAEASEYNAAYNLLRERKIDQAVTGFQGVVSHYPDGLYTANAYYWLGEIYVLKNSSKEAEKAFSAVVERFPAHRKAPDAMFKLGTVYHQQGQTTKAKEMLNKAAQSNSSAAGLAQAYLRDNF